MRAKDRAMEGHIYILAAIAHGVFCCCFFFLGGGGDGGDENLIDCFKMNSVCLIKGRLPYADQILML